MLRLRAMLLALVVTSTPLESSASDGSEVVCPLDGNIPSAGILIGYIANERRTGTTKVGPYRTLGLIENRSLRMSNGAMIREGMQFWSAVEPDAPPVELEEVSSFMDQVGDDHCVFHAHPNRDIARWTLLSSEPVPGMFKGPSESERKAFAEYHNDCVANGEYDEAKERSCSRRELLAISDVNENGAKEYWATEPYMWDTGITVWERSQSDFRKVHTVCTGCSD